MKDRLKETNPETLLKVLIEQDNVNLINEWITYSFVDDTIDSIFKSKLNEQMIDKIYESKCLSPDSKDTIFNKLSK